MGPVTPGLPPRVLVVGCGGIGGVLLSKLLGASCDVTVLTTNEAVRAALIEVGPRLAGRAVARPMSAERVLASLDGVTSKFDFVLLAVQPPQVEAAARDVADALSPSGRLVCLQNGLCEERLATIVGRERVVGSVVAWGASMPAPGDFVQTSLGGFTVGYLDGHEDEQLEHLVSLFSNVGATTRTSNLRGARWSKLAINCAVSTLSTLGGSRLGPLLAKVFVRRLALEIMTEAVLVARADGVDPEPLATTVDLDWLVLPARDRAGLGLRASIAARHALLLAVGARYRRQRSSMLAAIERGRAPAVDFLNGEVVDRGARLGIPTPVNARAREMVWEMAERRRLPGFETLRELAKTAYAPDALESERVA
jgi:2-dehydropantoate 2-reductase